MSEPMKDYLPLFNKLETAYGHGPRLILPNLLKMSIAADIIRQKQEDFLPEELKPILKQLGCNLTDSVLYDNAGRLHNKGVYIPTKNGRYRLNTELIRHLEVEFLPEGKHVGSEMTSRSIQLLAPLLYVSSLAIEGRPVFSTSSAEFLQIRAMAEKEADPKKALEILASDLKIPTKIKLYAEELRMMLIQSGVYIPLSNIGDLSHVAKLFHDGGIRLPRGCFDCGDHKTRCNERDDWDICYSYRLAEDVAKETIKVEPTVVEKTAVEITIEKPVGPQTVEKTVLEPKTASVETESVEMSAAITEHRTINHEKEEFRAKRIRWVEENLEKTKNGFGIQDDIYKKARGILNLLASERPAFVEKAIDLPKIILYASLIDIKSEGNPSILPTQGYERQSFSSTLKELSNLLHDIGSPLSHGCVDCFSYTGRECDRKYTDRKLEPWNVCISYTYDSRQKTTRSIQNGSIPQGQLTALRLLNKHQMPVFYRSDLECSIEDFRKLVEQGLASPQKIAGEETFRITASGINLIEKERKKKLEKLPNEQRKS